MYNPFWGSQITGATRRYLHTLEKKLGAIHSATDSVKATKSHAAIPGLGGLKVECYGRSYLFRNKLYLHCSHNGEYCKHKTPPYKYPDHIDDFKFIDENGRKYLHVAHKLKGKPLVDRDGQHLCKFALHGFKSKAWLLWHSRHKLIKTRELLYDYVHVVGLREGMLRGETPCDFVPRRELLRI